MKKIHTHYDNLKVTRDAPLDVIKAAYRVIAQKNHPDTNQSDDSERVMKIVNEAWRVLSDPKLRAEHDAWIAEQEKKTVDGVSGKQTYSSANFYASEGYKTKPSFRDRFPLKIGDLKNIFYVKSLIVWLAILGSMFVIGSIIEKIRPSRELEIAQTETPSNNNGNSATFVPIEAINDESKNIVLAEESNPPRDFSAELNLLPKDEKKSKISKENKSSPSSSEKPYHFFPAKLPNGYLEGEPIVADDSLSRLSVDNTKGDYDAEIRLYKDGAQVRAFNVQVGHKFTANKLPSGTYKFHYRMFYGDKYHVFEANNTFNITQNSTATGTQFSDIEVTLFKVSNGNMSVREIDENKF